MAIELTDDGTLDTVLRCSDCGEEMRYNYNPSYDPEDAIEGEDADQRAYDAFVEWAIADATEEHECAPDEDAEPTEPEEGDLTTTDHKVFYQDGRKALEYDPEHKSAYAYLNGAKFLGRFDSVNAAIRAYMDRVQFWPNCWFISDHGNAHLMDLSEGK
jgi:hypothetical protein